MEGSEKLKNNINKDKEVKNKNIKPNLNNVGIKNSNLNTKNKEKKEETLKKMLKNVDDEAKREEIIHMLLEQKVSKIIKEEEDEKKKFSSKFSNFVGSKKFLLFMTAFILVWVIINVIFLINKRFNPYSLVILDVILSCLMLIFCSLIVFNQNKKTKMDEKKSENDYKVNLKNEIIIEDLHYKLDDLIEKQNEMAKRVSQLETKKKAQVKREYKFIDITEHDKKKSERNKNEYEYF